jgi:hypothetical protein
MTLVAVWPEALPSVAGDATVGILCCYHGYSELLPQRVALLSTANGVATMCVHRWYRRQAIFATMGVRRCRQRRVDLLPWVCNLATGSGRRCYHGIWCCWRRRANLLSTMCGAATDGEQPCYHRCAALLPMAGGITTIVI